SSRMVNFAHGALAGLGAFVVFGLTTGGAGWPWPLAVVLAFASAIFLSVVIYLLISPLLKRSDPTAKIATLGFGLIAKGVILWLFGSNIYRLDLPLPSYNVQLLGINVSSY